jgi:hypothetical protein
VEVKVTRHGREDKIEEGFKEITRNLMDFTNSTSGSVAGSCEYGNEHSSSKILLPT